MFQSLSAPTPQPDAPARIQTPIGPMPWGGMPESGAEACGPAVSLPTPAFGLASGWGGMDAVIGEAVLDLACAMIPTRDVIYEQLAKVTAYGHGDGRQLATWGYRLAADLSIEQAGDGFGMAVLVPLPGAEKDPAIAEMHGGTLRPVIAFRGSDDPTVPENLDQIGDDWIDNDLCADTIGSPQFERHRGEIQGAIDGLGCPDVVGHSLGGALAQLAACRLGGVGRVVTFQSPGIAQEDADRLDPDITSTHYRAAGDVVPLAGEAMTDGHVVEIDLDSPDPISAHTDLLLTEVAERDGRDVPGLVGNDRETGVRSVTRTDAKDASFPGEGIRRSGGDVLELLAQAILALFVGPYAIPVALALAYELAGLIVDLYLDWEACAVELGWPERRAMLRPWVFDVMVAFGVPRPLVAALVDAVLDVVEPTLEAVCEAIDPHL